MKRAEGFHQNAERLREGKERMVREAAEGSMVATTPELEGDINDRSVQFPTRISRTPLEQLN